MRGRWALAIAAAVLLSAGVTVVIHAQSQAQSCALAAPRPELPPELRALGDFGQAYPAGDSEALRDAAQRVAAAADPGLARALALAPVREEARSPEVYTTLVVPLRRPSEAVSSGLVAFRLDCAGRPYYWRLHRPAPSAPVPWNFPVVDATQAASQLGEARPMLVTTGDPFNPEWEAGGRRIPATP
jgi:hypothetical protein